MVREFDELNIIQQEEVVESHEEFFSTMDLTDEEKRERIEFATEIEQHMLFIFALIGTMREYGALNTDYVAQKLVDRYIDTFTTRIGEPTEDVRRYIEWFSENVVGVTIANVKDSYFTSPNRAIVVGRNESLTSVGYSDFITAISLGNKHKVWVDVRDKRERKTHLKVGGKRIPIEQPFVVGNSLMMFPHDQVSFGADASEIVNCRCTVRYE